MNGSQKLMIISGGSRGLGLSLVGLALEGGWHVVELSRRGAGQDHPAYRHLPFDLMQPDAGLQAFDTLLTQLAAQEWRQVVLVNNAAAIGPILPLARLTDQAIIENAAVNFSGALRLLAVFARVFDAQAATKTVLNVSSGAALKGYPSWSLYCAAKAGLENFIRSLANEQEGKGNPMRCANFGPGVMDTDMQIEIRATPVEAFRDVGRFQQLKEEGKLRSPLQVAQAIMLLLADGVENGRRYVVDEFDTRLIS